MEPDSPKSMQMQDRELLWNWALHEDQLYDSRMNTFLVVHSLLVLPISTAIAENRDLRDYLPLASTLGTLLGLLWWIVLWRAHCVLKSVCKRLEEREDSVYQFNGVPLPSQHQTGILLAVPVIVGLAWLGTLVWTFLRASSS